MNNQLKTKILTPRSAELVSSRGSDNQVYNDGRELAHKLFSKIKSRGRFRGYDQTQIEKQLIAEIKDTIVSSGKEITLEEIVFPVNESVFTHCVSLCGRGGSGKTHQFITLIDGILNGIVAESSNNHSERVQKYPHIIPLFQMEGLIKETAMSIAPIHLNMAQLMTSLFSVIQKRIKTENTLLFCMLYIRMALWLATMLLLRIIRPIFQTNTILVPLLGLNLCVYPAQTLL